MAYLITHFYEDSSKPQDKAAIAAAHSANDLPKGHTFFSTPQPWEDLERMDKHG